MTTAIEVANVSKSFRRHRPDRPMMLQEVLARGFGGFRTTEQFWALRDVSFSVPRGRAVGIIGTNGSGKSTLLRLVGGIGSVDSGTVRVNGRIGALLDLGSGIHPDLTGRENVIVAGVLSGLSRREVMRRFDDIVAFSEIGQFIDNPMRTYSSGMQMRLAFAINVHTDPDVLLIDEVLAVGDAAFQHKCLDRIRQFKANGCSILLVSHGLAVVQQLCDEVLWMHNGQPMAQGQVRDVVKKYQEHVGFNMEIELAPETAQPTMPVVPPPPSSRVAPSNEARASELTILEVVLSDDTGHPVSHVTSGREVQVAIDFETSNVSTTPRFQVTIVRDDGLVCCDFSTDRMAAKSPVSRHGRVVLFIDRLDLNSGHYSLDVVALGAHGVEGRPVGVPLTISGDSVRDAVLAVPHRWDFTS